VAVAVGVGVSVLVGVAVFTGVEVRVRVGVKVKVCVEVADAVGGAFVPQKPAKVGLVLVLGFTQAKCNPTTMRNIAPTKSKPKRRMGSPPLFQGYVTERRWSNPP
jgi:hypothetical protein